MIHGTARFATDHDLQVCGLIWPIRDDLLPNHPRNPEVGLFLGLTTGSHRPIRYDGPSHLLTVAPNRTGKTVGVVIPNLLSDPGYWGSLVVTDIKGELAAVTARFRREVLHHKVYVINPWREEMRAAMGGHDLGDDPFNPLAILQADSPTLLADAFMLARLLVPLPRQGGRMDMFFKEQAQSLIKLVLAWMVLNAEKIPDVTLPALREILLARLDDVLNDLTTDQKPFEDPLRRSLQAEAVATKNVKDHAPKQFLGAFGEAKAALDIYDDAGALAKHLSAPSSLDFRKIKHERSTVYIVIPSHRLTDYRRWFDLVVGSAVKAVSAAPVGGKVLFLFDEFGNLGHLPYIHDEVCGSPAKGL